MQTGCELRLGRWQDVLADVVCDALITDAPYSEVCHQGHNEVIGNGCADRSERQQLSYPHWTADDVRGFVASWAPRTKGWMVSITDDELAPVWKAAMREAGRCVFAAVPYVATGSRVRLQGDGPSSWACMVMVSRPRNVDFARWGTLPGAYVLPPGESREQLVPGGKTMWLMRSLVRDYSKPGNLICDPCAGAATTLVAAQIEHRSAIGAEMLPQHHDIAQRRLRRGFTPSLFAEEP